MFFRVCLDTIQPLGRLLACVLVALLAGTIPAAAEEGNATFASPVVPGFQRFYATPEADLVRGGSILLGELNCTSCHQGTSTLEPFVPRKSAPVLDGIGQRVRASWLRNFLAHPHVAKPGTTMPDVLSGLSAQVREEHLEALVHLLASTGQPVESAPDRKLVASGQKLFQQVGCLACHGPREGNDPASQTSVPLGDLASKYTLAGLNAFLSDPLKVRPSGRMPQPNLSANETRDVVHYLMKDSKYRPPQLPHNLNYSYYEGNWMKLPEFEKLKPTATDTSAGFDLEVTRRPNNYALKFQGYFVAPTQGQYNFYVTSDDGGRLWIDDQEVVNNDGVHPATEARGKASVTRQPHLVTVAMFDSGGDTVLQVEFDGQGLPRQPLAPWLALTKDAVPPIAAPRPAAAAAGSGEDIIIPDPQLVEKGKRSFAALGCANCHQLQKIKPDSQTELTMPAFAELRTDRGCLSPNPSGNAPRFDLSPVQRTALTQAVNALAKPPAAPPTEEETIARTLTVFNCYACHERGGIGGVEEARNDLFTGTQKEMGDEGRIPPLLTGVGAKLTAQWMQKIFSTGSNDREYMHTRMPTFGVKNVGHLVAALEAVDVLPPVAVPTFKEPLNRVKSTGRQLVGGQVFGCIKCHNFGGVKATGIQSIDMAVMTQRLKRDWFHRYVVDPPAFRPGTRMPSAWPMGKVIMKNVLEGSADQQIEAVWLYLSDGPKAAVPYGLGRDPIELVADTSPVMYRNFIEGAGPRAIGVGYPEKANLAFDASDLRLALIWQGAFIDASKHWIGRGAGFQTPLGDNVVRLPPGPSVARLPADDAPWPSTADKSQGYQFQGYRLTKDLRPAFQYDLGSVHIEDFPEPIIEKHPALRRTITVTADGAESSLWLRVAVASKIEPTENGWYAVGEELKVRIESAGPPIVRKAGNNLELLVPLHLDSKKPVTVVQEYVW